LSALEQGIDAFSNHIAMVGRAWAMAGALNFLKILIHFVMILPTERTKESWYGDNVDDYLRACFCYKNCDSNKEHDVSPKLLNLLLGFCCQLSTPLVMNIPEVYDTWVLALQLLLVLLSTQLYRPMTSSF